MTSAPGLGTLLLSHPVSGLHQGLHFALHSHQHGDKLGGLEDALLQKISLL